MKSKSFWFGITVLTIFVFVSIFAEFIAPHDPNLVDMTNRLAFSSSEYILGTDHLGRDLFSRLIYGSRSSVFIAFLGTGSTMLIGISIGLISGYLGGVVDQAIQGVVNIFQGIPTTAFVVAVLGLLGPGIESLMIAIVISSWASFSRIVRNQVLEIKEMHYVEGAKALGAGSIYIMLRHILPNIILPILVLMATRISSTVITVASMSFLGLGLKAPQSDWGIMISDAKGYYMKNFMNLLAPAFCIGIFCLSVNLISDSIRDYADYSSQDIKIL